MDKEEVIQIVIDEASKEYDSAAELANKIIERLERKDDERSN